MAALIGAVIDFEFSRAQGGDDEHRRVKKRMPMTASIGAAGSAVDNRISWQPAFHIGRGYHGTQGLQIIRSN